MSKKSFLIWGTITIYINCCLLLDLLILLFTFTRQTPFFKKVDIIVFVFLACFFAKNFENLKMCCSNSFFFQILWYIYRAINLISYTHFLSFDANFIFFKFQIELYLSGIPKSWWTRIESLFVWTSILIMRLT